MIDRLLTFNAEDIVVPETDVLHSQGMPPDYPVTGNLERALKTGRDQFVRFAEPAAVCFETDKQTFISRFLDTPDKPGEIPLDRIVPKAHRLVLFVATLGKTIDSAIEKCFTGHEYTAGLFLDTYASLGVSRLINRLETETAQPGEPVLAYCPGYCGWPITLQHELLEQTAAHRIGVTLNTSCLMSPLKSASGVLISGTKTTHQFINNYAFCADCTSKTCRQRLASLEGKNDERHTG